MNKKGFTLVELLATIVILAIIMGIGTSATLSVLQKNKEKMLEIKKKSIVEAAVIYGQEENHTKFSNCNVNGNNYSNCYCEKVQKLIDGDYLNAEDDGKLKNDVDGSDLGQNTFCIYRKNNRVNAEYFDVTYNSNMNTN